MSTAEERRLFREWDLELIRGLMPPDFELELEAGVSPAEELELFTLDEVVGITKRSRRQLYRDRDAGRLRIVYPFGERAPRVTREDLDNYRAGSTATLAPPTPLRKRQP